jgi:methionine sulfoxide reductase heme-binding subunit
VARHSDSSSFQDRLLFGRFYFADGLQVKMNRPRRGIHINDSVSPQDASPHISRARTVTACALSQQHRSPPLLAGFGKIEKRRRAPAALRGDAMSHQYQAIGWNRQKRVYDIVLLTGVALYIAIFIGFGVLLSPYATAETLIIRAAGSGAFLLLHVVLCIGPLCRLDSRFLPLLYNRRHLGVATFLLGAVHGIFAIIQFHSLGDKDPLVSLLTSNQNFKSLPDFPFQQLGFLALIILFLMAATSHDFWLRNFTPPIWKSLHMLVYVAYALLIGHVTLGLLQSETSPMLAVATGAGLVTVLSLHPAAGSRERGVDLKKLKPASEGFVDACSVESIPEKCAAVVSLSGERVAIFKFDGKISAISNVCRHQNGPLGEGKIIDGCVTCPWHGYQYLPETGASPPPFTEKVSTFQTKIANGRVWIDPKPNPPGTHVEPSRIPDAGARA